MTVHDALADGRLADAISLQEADIAAAPTDPAARRLLVDLLAFAGRLDDARTHLANIHSDEPEWHDVERSVLRLFRAETRRSVELRQPQIRPEPAPRHATRRWLAMKAIRRGKPDDAVKCIDAADSVSPEIRGFLDGQEFVGLRDADDRFGSVLEAFLGGEYFWFTWESIRKLTISPPAVLLDQLYRPAMLSLKDGALLLVHLPMVYPRSHQADNAFALGFETDHVCPDGGPSRCVGGKLLLIGDEDEIPLTNCRMIEIR
jgi:type VI secretion system protein ImpE